MRPKRAVATRRHEPYTRVPRPEILATAVELVREQGLSNVRVVDVAERAGISPTSVIYHFASKYQLFEQAAADADRAFYAALRPELAALESGGCDYAALLQAADRVPIPPDPQSSNREDAE